VCELKTETKYLAAKILFIFGILNVIASIALFFLKQFVYVSTDIVKLVFTIPNYGYVVFPEFNIWLPIQLLFLVGIALAVLSTVLPKLNIEKIKESRIFTKLMSFRLVKKHETEDLSPELMYFKYHGREKPEPKQPKYIIRKRYLVYAFVFFLFVNILIFRDPLLQTPAILAGEQVLSTGELVPIFDFQTQFLDQLFFDFSDLTHNNEIRLRYSVLTAWTRYFPILPSMITIFSAISALLLFTSSFILLKKIFPSQPDTILGIASASSSLIISLVLIYAKITYYYSLIFGFSIFVLSLVFLAIFLFDGKIRFLVASAVLNLFNPTVHYHVLFLFTLPIIFGTYFMIYRKKLLTKIIIKKIIAVSLFLFFVSVLPYLLYINFTIPISDISSQVPISYEIIDYASPPSFLYILTLEFASPINKELFGDFFLKSPRLLFIIYFLISLIPMLLFTRIGKKIGVMDINKRYIILLYAFLAVGFWMSIGYTSSVSFHSFLSWLGIMLYSFSGELSAQIQSLLYWVLQILRFPDRFYFIFLFGILQLVAVGLVIITNKLANIFSLHSKKTKLLAVLLGAIILVPFATPSYFNTLTSGNLSGFLSPYVISDELIIIKEILDKDKTDHKTIVVPSTELGLRLYDNQNSNINLADKFYIYFLNRPSFNFVTSGNDKVRTSFFLLYRSWWFNEQSWINVIKNNNIKYIVFHNDLKAGISQKYLFGITEKIQNALDTSFDIEKVYTGENYSLYKVKNFINLDEKQCSIFLDSGWFEFLEFNRTHKNLYDECKVWYSFNFDSEKTGTNNLTIYSNDETKLYLDWFALNNRDKFYSPLYSITIFSDEIVSSNIKSWSMFNWFGFIGTKYNPFGIPVPGFNYDSIKRSFVSSKIKSVFRVPFEVDETGDYHLFIRVKTTDNKLFFTLAGASEYRFFVEDKDKFSELIKFKYIRVGKARLKKGNYELTIDKEDKNPFLLEGLLVLSDREFQNLEIKDIPVFKIS